MIQSPRAVIDIGSNAIRLVVYGGPPRAPMPIYNEKARIALGEGVAKTGSINSDVMAAAIATLVRFDALTKAMNVGERRVVATEATRKANNGAEFLAKAAEAGIIIELINGTEEALASALGVVCDMPWATGYVADQGGGSLELAKVANGVPHLPVSMAFGTIPLSNRDDLDPKSVARDIEAGLGDASGFTIERGLPLHLVGGAWRTLARLHMHLTQNPLSVLSNHVIPREDLGELAKAVDDRMVMENSGVVSEARIDYMPAALVTVEALERTFRPSEIVVSVYGLREGLLFDRLSNEARGEDPLIAAARHEGTRLSRFAYHGDGIADWIAPSFEEDDHAMHRLRHAACLLADSAWNSHPDYRAKRAAEIVLEANWPGVTTVDRAIMASALFAAYGGRRSRPPLLDLLAPAAALDRAAQWGLAIRLAQRLDGGTGFGLSGVTLKRQGAKLSLYYADAYRHLDASTVRRRLKHLNEAVSASQP